ncbi:MAG: PDZ domain-containing protein [Bacteroidota bacterium]
MKIRFWLSCTLVFLILIFSGGMVMAEDISYYLTEQEIWVIPEFFNDAGAALGALKNIQKDFTGWQGCPVRQIELDRFGLRISGVLDTTYDKWVYTGIGILGGHYETVPYHEEELTVVPFDQVRTMRLFFYPKLDRDNKYGLRIALNNGKRVDFRAIDQSTVKQLANAVATLVLASGNKIYPITGLSVVTDKKEDAKIKKKLKWKEEYGAVIEKVVPESPAAGAGLKANDIILEVNGAIIIDGSQLVQRLTEIGEKDFSAVFELKVFSGGETLSRKFQLIDPNKGWTGKSPRTAVENTSKPAFGISVRPVNADDQKTLGLPGQDGLLVTEVKKDSPAERLTLRAGDVILAVNGVATKNIDQLKDALASGEVKSVKVFRGGAEVLLEAAESF